MKDIFKQLFTGKDNETHDLARWMWAFGVITFICFSGYNLYKGVLFDMVNFSVGFAAVMAAGAGSVKIKESTEPISQ